MKRIDLFGNKQQQLIRPPQLNLQTIPSSKYQKLNKSMITQSDKKLKNQIPQRQIRNKQMAFSLLTQKQKKNELKKQASSPAFKILGHRDTVTSITLQNDQINDNLQQNQSPYPQIKGFSKNLPPLNNKYLSIASIPEDYQFRPSKNSIQRGYKKWEQDEFCEQKCKECQYEGQILGWVGWSWIVFLFLATVILFWIPIVFKKFKEKQIICPQCGNRVGLEKPTCL